MRRETDFNKTQMCGLFSKKDYLTPDLKDGLRKKWSDLFNASGNSLNRTMRVTPQLERNLRKNLIQFQKSDEGNTTQGFTEQSFYQTENLNQAFKSMYANFRKKINNIKPFIDVKSLRLTNYDFIPKNESNNNDIKKRQHHYRQLLKNRIRKQDKRSESTQLSDYLHALKNQNQKEEFEFKKDSHYNWTENIDFPEINYGVTDNIRIDKFISYQSQSRKNSKPEPVAKSNHLILLEKEYGPLSESLITIINNTVDLMLPQYNFNMLKEVEESRPSTRSLKLSRKDCNCIRLIYSTGQGPTQAETIFSKMNLFSLVSLDKRLLLYQAAQYKQYKKGEILVKKNEIEDIFVIINGTARVKSSNYQYQKVLKEGDVYADELIISSSVNPSGIMRYSYDIYSIEAKETLDIIKISRQDFLRVMKEDAKDSLCKKLYTLKKCTLFKTVPLTELVEFASKGQVVQKRYCKILAKQGEIPKCCFIIINGKCKSVYETIIHNEHSPDCKSSAFLQTSLKFGQNNERSACNDVILFPKNYHSRRNNNLSFHNQIIDERKTGEFTFKNQVEFEELGPGDCFCQRVLLPNLAKLSTCHKGGHWTEINGGIQPSQLTIV